MIIAILWVASLIVVFFVGRNNPNLGAVNKLIAAKKAIIDATGAVRNVL